MVIKIKIPFFLIFGFKEISGRFMIIKTKISIKKASISIDLTIKSDVRLFVISPASFKIIKSRIFRPTPRKSIFSLVPRPMIVLSIGIRLKTSLSFFRIARKKSVIQENRIVFKRKEKGFFSNKRKPSKKFKWANISIIKIFNGKYIAKKTICLSLLKFLKCTKVPPDPTYSHH